MNFPTIGIIFSLFFCAVSAGICSSRPRARSCPLPRQKSNSTASHDGSLIDSTIAYCHQTHVPNFTISREVVEPKISLSKLRTVSANSSTRLYDEASSSSGGGGRKKSRGKTEKRAKIYFKGT
uniref:Secreted protein n=1 Tax=Globodera rostochiensis TaxID=31243 RepID=A0A914HLT9_GLORO